MDWPVVRDGVGFLGVSSSSKSRLSVLGSRSDNCRSAGGGVLRRSSLEIVGVLWVDDSDECEEWVEDADESGDAVAAARSWSLSADISALASII